MKKILYLGLNPERYSHEGDLFHYPVIRIVPYPIQSSEIQKALSNFKSYTHLIFTSRSAVKIILAYLDDLEISLSTLSDMTIVAVGRATAALLTKCGFPPSIVANEETSEGVVALLKASNLENAYVFYPYSALSRGVIQAFLRRSNIRHCSCPIYSTHKQKLLPVPNLDEFDELVFTSPSTVDAFIDIYGTIPPGKNNVAIGPVTRGYLKQWVQES